MDFRMFYLNIFIFLEIKYFNLVYSYLKMIYQKGQILF
jgi:hypothetical protein